MNAPDLVYEITELTVTLLRTQTSGATETAGEVAEILLEIANVTARAYPQFAGEPLDPSLIQFEAPL